MWTHQDSLTAALVAITAYYAWETRRMRLQHLANIRQTEDLVDANNALVTTSGEALHVAERSLALAARAAKIEQMHQHLGRFSHLQSVNTLLGVLRLNTNPVRVSLANQMYALREWNDVRIAELAHHCTAASIPDLAILPSSIEIIRRLYFIAESHAWGDSLSVFTPSDEAAWNLGITKVQETAQQVHALVEKQRIFPDDVLIRSHE